MHFVFRPVRIDDIGCLEELTSQFSLLNLPKDRKIIQSKVELSLKSFEGEVKPAQGLFIFVTENVETGVVVGCSQILSRSGTEKNPCYSFEVKKKERFSKNLGIGFIHQILKLKTIKDGPTEIGGLIVSSQFRGRPEKVGALTSLARFLYIGLNRGQFQENLHAELAPPLTEDGRSEFWESLGRRFTGLPYQEADMLSRSHKEFIKSLFPEEDIYVCLLGSKAKLSLGQVGEKTLPALHMLKKLGFKYENEVDPFDGGPHLGAMTDDISIIKNLKTFRFVGQLSYQFSGQALIGAKRGQNFKAILSAYHIEGESIELPQWAVQSLNLSKGECVSMVEVSS